MIIPRSPQLRSEDFDASVQGWIGRLLSPLNTFISSVTSAINGGLTFNDNMLGQQKALSFIYSTGVVPLTFLSSFTGTPGEVKIVKATENGTAVVIQAAWQVSGSDTTTGKPYIQLTDLTKISGGAASALVSGATYNLTLRIAA